MIANVQHQANNQTARVQEETRGFQGAVQDNAGTIIAQRVAHEASGHQNSHGNIHHRDQEYMQLIQSRDEEYVSSMAAVTTQRDVDLLKLSHARTMLEESQDALRAQVQEAQTYRQEITSYRTHDSAEPMAPEDPYFDEDEDEINKLEQVLKDKRDALAAQRRKIEATRGL
eukprot:2630305-Amphidinium_carterae.1